ncbi:UbiA family prenyltransferase [uncultured Desulfobulbus sp.]|uniref:UbiA family prenyltransferase n=1 Tax=uncultured Desulfobulbus sp. TaxID=239745 RepID=UPI0029C94685|nr:UbiA family prenyltransferase [uncultured Desulfobulbus sp.]
MVNHYTSNDLIPLVVDLDGTLTLTDTLVESLVQLVKGDPLSLLHLPSSLMAGRAAFKRYIASRVTIKVNLFPYHSQLLAYLKDEKAKGRKLVLATAAHISIAKAVAAHLGLFDEIIATEAGGNLKGSAKLEMIRKSVGERFAYAGDSKADMPIWESAEAAVLVSVSRSLASMVERSTFVEREFPREQTGPKDWIKAIRVYQWIKNSLVFIPLLTSFGFSDPTKVIDACFAFIAFSFAASATYILNDIWDIDNDRMHPRKRSRPFASARISIPLGVFASFILLVVSLMIAATLSKGFLISLLTYIAITSAYSWILKTYVLIDVLILSLLYTLRILAGSLAIEVSTSSWLMAFSVFLFFGLAIIKRCTELVSLADSGQTATQGRNYLVADLTVLWPLGIGTSLNAVVVFGLYINSAETQARYDSPQLLWLVGVGLLYWVSRLWIKTLRREMPDDPIIFAVKDFGSRVTVICMVAVTIAAHFLHFNGI